VFEVDVTIPNADGRLKPGSVAALSLESGGDAATATAPLIPLSAIVRSPGHPAQFAVSSSRRRVATRSLMRATSSSASTSGG